MSYWERKSLFLAPSIRHIFLTVFFYKLMTWQFLLTTIYGVDEINDVCHIWLICVSTRVGRYKILFKRSGSMEPQKILIFGLGFIFLAGITLFISFKLQSSIKTKKNKNLVNLLSFLFLAVASIFIFRMYSQEYIAALN